MATPDSDLPDRYNLVSSLYGPGTTACWYLTVLSCLVSWTLHPKKRKSGSLDSDFIVVLTFPAVAAGHLISQIHGYPDDKAELLTTSDPDFLLRIAAIEAPLNITETSMPTLALIFILALYSRCIKRAIYTALVGMFCAAAESYMFIVTWSVENSQQNLSRPFLINFAWISLGILALLFTLLTFTLGLLLMFCFKRRPYPFRPSRLAEWPALRERHPDPYEDIHLQTISSITLLALPFGMIGSLSPLLIHTLSNSSDGFSSWICKAAIRLIQGLFPRTNVSIMDLDQAVAVLAGATVLGFGLYGAANAHYQKWLESVRAREEHRATDIRNHRGSHDERREEHRGLNPSIGMNIVKFHGAPEVQWKMCTGQFGGCVFFFQLFLVMATAVNHPVAKYATLLEVNYLVTLASVNIIVQNTNARLIVGSSIFCIRFPAANRSPSSRQKSSTNNSHCPTSSWNTEI